jgi:DNA modification methylase
MSVQILTGDWLTILKTLPDASVNCCVTSPPYFGLRDYGVPGQLGLEPTPDEYVAKLVEGFREVRRVLRDDGTLWLNLGDSFAGSGKARDGGGDGPKSGKQKTNRGAYFEPPTFRPGSARADGIVDDERSIRNRNGVGPVSGCKPKDLIGIPWLVAFALRADGWYLRQYIPWIKRNPMPESAQDRPTSSCETFFLLSKSDSYYFDVESIKLPGSLALQQQVEQGYNGKATKDFAANGVQNASAVKSRIIAGHRQRQGDEKEDGWRLTRNSDWFFESLGGLLLNEVDEPLAFVVNPNGFKGSHFATFPPQLVLPCILAGCPKGGTILDPFGGSGTVGLVADRNERNALLIELNPDYAAMAEKRIHSDSPLFSQVTRL